MGLDAYHNSSPPSAVGEISYGSQASFVGRKEQAKVADVQRETPKGLNALLIELGPPSESRDTTTGSKHASSLGISGNFLADVISRSTLVLGVR